MQGHMIKIKDKKSRFAMAYTTLKISRTYKHTVVIL